MNRRRFAQGFAVIAIASVAVFAKGCWKGSLHQMEDREKNCEHEWEDSPSGDKRCKKCGKYKED